MSEIDRPAFSSITSTTLSEDEGDESEGCSSTKQPATAMPSGSAYVENSDFLAECQSQGCVALQ